MGINLVVVSIIVNAILFPLLLAAIFKRSWKYTKYLWLAVAVLGTVDLALHLSVGTGTGVYILDLVIVGYALWNTYSYFKRGKEG